MKNLGSYIRVYIFTKSMDIGLLITPKTAQHVT